MTHLTDEETAVLRATLGLSYHWRETPTRNHLIPSEAEKYPAAVESLKERRFLRDKKLIGQGGWEHYHVATPAGIEAVRDQRWPD